MVEIIQKIQETQTQIEGPSTSMEGWNTTWLGMPNTEKRITIEEIFLDIGKQMLKTIYTLNLGQLFKIAPKFKRYIW
jgi:hypothetical protein